MVGSSLFAVHAGGVAPTMGRNRRGNTARSFKALRDWPNEAIAHLHREFARRRLGAGRTADQLLRDLKGRWGIKWNDSSLSRYYGFWLSSLNPRPRDPTPLLAEIRDSLLRIEGLLKPRAKKTVGRRPRR